MAGPVKWGGEALVNTASIGYQMSPRMAALDTGRYVVAW